MEGLIDYSRQQEFNRTFGSKMNEYYHAIIGCGGVGFWLGIILAMQGYNNFTLFDGQKLEPSNMNRIPVPPGWVGIKKVTALRKIIRQLRPETNIVNFPNHITEENLDVLGKMISVQGMTFIIWDCTDDARIQRKVYDWCKNNPSILYRKIGYEGFTAGSYKNYDVWTAPDYQPGYRTSNACASSSAFAAVMGFMAEGLNIRHDVNIDIRKILAKPVETKVEEVIRVVPQAPNLVPEGMPIPMGPFSPIVNDPPTEELLASLARMTDRQVAGGGGIAGPDMREFTQDQVMEMARQEDMRRREARTRRLIDSQMIAAANNAWTITRTTGTDDNVTIREVLDNEGAENG